MPKDLKDFPRPPSDNGRGIVISHSSGWNGGEQGFDYWVKELADLGIKWVKILDHAGDSLPLCEKLVAAGIFPIVHILRRDPAPNDTPEPNPGHINIGEEQTIRKLVSAGVLYFETNNEPNLVSQWKLRAMPGNTLETAKLVALNWLFDARFILAAGGLPGLPAISVGGNMDLMGALVALGRQDILLEGCWIALHNYSLNRPLDYPEDAINRAGQSLTPEQYDQGAYTQWAWWNTALERADTIEEINTMRAVGKNPGHTIYQEHAGFREFEYYGFLAMKYLGRAIPVISTENGYRIGQRPDARYPRTTPELHREQTVALFDFVQRQAPDYYFAALPVALLESKGKEHEAWYSPFWQTTLKEGSDGREDIPSITVPRATVTDHLSVVDAVKNMANLARRMPGVQPAPPVQIPTTAQQMRPSLKYVVMPGDTTEQIAKRFGTTPQLIAALNQLGSADLIKAGQTILIPRTESALPSSSETETRATAPAPFTPPPTHPARSGLDVLFPESEPIATPIVVEPEVARTVTPPPPPIPVQIKEPEIQPTPVLNTQVPTKPIKTEPQVSPVPIVPVVSEPIIKKETEPVAATPVSTSTPPPMFEPPETLGSPESLSTPTEPEPEPTPIPSRPMPGVVLPPLPKLQSEQLQLEWDWRLDALNIGLEEALVEPGEPYWKLTRADYQSPEEANGTHHIYYVVLDDKGKAIADQKVWQGWANDMTDAKTNDKGQANIPLWQSYTPDHNESGPYYAWVDELPSDRVYGMGLPQKKHVNFVLTWQRTVK